MDRFRPTPDPTPSLIQGEEPHDGTAPPRPLQSLKQEPEAEHVAGAVADAARAEVDDPPVLLAAGDVKLERRRMAAQANHYALKGRLYAKALQSAFREWRRLRQTSPALAA